MRNYKIDKNHNNAIVNLLCMIRDKGHITDVNELDALDTLINAIDIDVTAEYARIIEMWYKSNRFDDESQFVKKNVVQMTYYELTDTQIKVLNLLIDGMSQDNMICINQHDIYEVYGFKQRHTLIENLKRLSSLGYIVQVPYSELNKYAKLYNKQTGTVYMINPLLACKRANSDALEHIYADLIGSKNMQDFKYRANLKKYVTDTIQLGTNVTKNHRIRVNNQIPVNKPQTNKKAPAQKGTDALKPNNIVPYDATKCQVNNNTGGLNNG